MLGEVVSQVDSSRCPVDVELVLFNAVVEPVEAHVDGFGSVLPDGGVDNDVGCAIVGADGSGRLRMS